MQRLGLALGTKPLFSPQDYLDMLVCDMHGIFCSVLMRFVGMGRIGRQDGEISDLFYHFTLLQNN